MADDEIISESKKALNPSTFQIKPFSNFLAGNLAVQTVYGSAMGFFLYFSMYALRKPFSAAKFEDENGVAMEFFNTGMSLKTALVMFQIVGYMSSKFIGVKLTPEAKGVQDKWLVVLYFCAMTVLVMFGIVGTHAPSFSPFVMFFHGLPLGLVWGMVIMYFEGRTGSDFQLVVLCISFVVSSGIVKDVGLSFMARGVSQFWSPAMVGACFGPLYLGCTFGLNQLPPPSNYESKEKGNRLRMTGKDRWEYFIKFWPGLSALWIAIAFLTAFRDYRDTFSVEIIEGTGVDLVPGTLSQSESTVAGVLLIPIACLVFIKKNLFAFKITLLFCCAGCGVLLVAVYTYLGSSYDGITYYMITGVASYLAYVPFHSVLYERLIAVLREPCTISYMHQVVDSTGYLGVFTIYLFAEYADFENHLDVFNSIGQAFAWIMLALFVFTYFYFIILRSNHVNQVDEGEDKLEASDDTLGKDETGDKDAEQGQHEEVEA